MSAVHHQKPSLMGYQALLKIFYLQLMASRILKDYASFLETNLVRYAAKNATPEDIHRLEKVLSIHHNSLRTPEVYAQYDIEFHSILADIPDNKVLKTIHSAFLNG